MHPVETYWHHARLFVYDLLRAMTPTHHEDFSQMVCRDYVFQCHKQQKSAEYQITAGEMRNNVGFYILIMVPKRNIEMTQKIMIDRTRIQRCIVQAENFYENRFIVDFVTLGFCAPNDYLEVCFLHNWKVVCPLSSQVSVEIPPLFLLMGSGFLEKAQSNPFFSSMKSIQRFLIIANTHLDNVRLSIMEVVKNIYRRLQTDQEDARAYILTMFSETNDDLEKAARNFTTFAQNVERTYNRNANVKILQKVSLNLIKYWVCYEGE